MNVTKICHHCLDFCVLSLSKKNTNCKYCGHKLFELNEDFLLHVIKSNPYIILYLNDISEQAKIKAIKQDNSLILKFNEQTESMQLAIVSCSGLAIRYCKNPSKKVWEKAIIQNPYCIEWLDTYDEDLINKALTVTNKVKKIVDCLKVKFDVEEHN